MSKELLEGSIGPIEFTALLCKFRAQHPLPQS